MRFDFGNSKFKCNEDKKFFEVKLLGEYVTSMLVVGDGLFIGQSDTVLHYCELNPQRICRKVYRICASGNHWT